MGRLKRLPADLPWLLGAAAGSSFLSWGFGSIFAEQAIGRPSSTSSLACIFIPFWGVVFAAGGFVVGLVLRGLVSDRAVPPRPSPAYCTALLGGLVVVSALAAMHGVRGVRRLEEDARPRVLSSSPGIDREILGSASWPARVRPAEVVWISRADQRPVTPDRSLPTITFGGLSASFQLGHWRSIALDLPGLSYVTSAYIVPLMRGGSPQGYAAVINGRATGRRSVIAVLSGDLRLLYAELVERWWQLDDVPLFAEVGDKDVMPEAAIVGRVGDRAIRFRLRDRPNNEEQPRRPAQTPREPRLR
jgi:hypothetical protein